MYEGFEPGQERLREALCTLGNGYFATRGAAAEAEADEIHYPGTYVAGGYNRLKTDIAGRTIENEDLVNFPNWLPLSFCPEGGTWFSVRAVDILSYRQELDHQTRNSSSNCTFSRQLTDAERQCPVGVLFTLAINTSLVLKQPLPQKIGLVLCLFDQQSTDVC